MMMVMMMMNVFLGFPPARVDTGRLCATWSRRCSTVCGRSSVCCCCCFCSLSSSLCSACSCSAESSTSTRSSTSRAATSTRSGSRCSPSFRHASTCLSAARIQTCRSPDGVRFRSGGGETSNFARTPAEMFAHTVFKQYNFGTSQRAVMPCGWKGNRRSDVALATRHRQWFSTCGLEACGRGR